MSSHSGHVTTETVFGQTLALRLGNGNEHHPLESDTTGLNVKGKLYLYCQMGSVTLFRVSLVENIQEWFAIPINPETVQLAPKATQAGPSAIHSIESNFQPLALQTDA